MSVATAETPLEKIETVVETRVDENGRKIMITKKILKKIVHHKVSKDVAIRRQWKKFGIAASHPPGPSTSTTLLGEDVFLNLTKDKNFDLEEASDNILKTAPKSIQCRHCKGSHWTSKCPFKDMPNIASGQIDDTADPVMTTTGGSKYLPPSLRNKDTETRDDSCTIRLTNLPDYCTEVDLRNLCAFKPVTRVYLSKDFETGRCKGYAFVTFAVKEDAAEGLSLLNGHGYGNLILKAEWAAKKQ